MYKQLEWVLLDAHANLLDIFSENQAGNEKLIVQRCERLSALIAHSTIPQNDQLLALQEKVIQANPAMPNLLILNTQLMSK